MKQLLILILFFPFIINAQDCNLKNEKDRLNQDPRLTTGFKSIGAGSNKFLLSISADKKEIDNFFALDKSATCFNDLSRVLVTFENKQRGTYKNGGTTNCKGYFHFIFPNQQNLNVNRDNLSEKKIVSLQFTGVDNKKEILTLRPEDQEEMIKITTCVLAELEKLRIDTWKPKQ